MSICVLRTAVLTALGVLLVLHALVLAAHAWKPDRLVVAQDSTSFPYCCIGEDGQPNGYLVEVWKQFGRANNIRIEFKLGTWQESLDMVENGQADVHGGLFYSKERDVFLDFGPEIIATDSYLYIRKSLSVKESRQCPGGVVKGDHAEAFMRTQRPDRSLILYPQIRSLVLAASFGNVQAFLTDESRAVHYMRRFGIEDVFEPVDRLYSKFLFAVVRQGNTRVLEYIDSGWGNMNPNMLRVIRDKWFVAEEDGDDWLLPALGACFFFLLAGAFIHRIVARVCESD